MRKRSISTKGEIISLLLDNKLPGVFNHADVRALLPHRSTGAIGGALSDLFHKQEVLKSWGKGRNTKYKLHPWKTADDLRAIPVGSEIFKGSYTRKCTKRTPTPTPREIKAEAVAECRALFERTLTQLAKIERLLLTLEQEAALNHVTQATRDASKVPGDGVASSLHTTYNKNRDAPASDKPF